MPFKKLLESCEIFFDEMQIGNLENVGLDRTLESYFLVGPYPPLMQLDDYYCGNSFQIKESKNNEFVDLYMHFPYCRVVGKNECSFCPFYKETYNSSMEHEVVKNWIKEIELYKKLIGNLKVSTIYFGGGTVSLITPENLKVFVDYLNQNVGMEHCSEVKFEIHADASKEPEKLYGILDILKLYKDKLKLLIDIQSLNPQTLTYVSWGRISTVLYFQTLRMVIEKGFRHICTGLIMGLPFETPESFLEGLSQLIAIPEIEMLSIYPLMFRECDHVFGCLKHSPEIMFDVRTRDIVYLATRKLLRSFGFLESPIYFYSRGDTKPEQQQNKFESKNSLIGIGPSAFGYINTPDLNLTYYNLIPIAKYNEQLDKQMLPFWKISALKEDSKHIHQIVRGKLQKLEKFDLNMLGGSLKERVEGAFNVFRLYGLLENKSGRWELTEKGILRVEEMSYYLAEIDLGEKLAADISETLKTQLHCFPNRTKEQVLKWRAGYKNYACKVR